MSASISGHGAAVRGRGYVLTFSTTPDRAAADAPVVDRIARSIVLAP